MAQKGVFTTSDYLPFKEYQSTVMKLHEDKDYISELYFIVAFTTALRVSDLRMLKWSDILDQKNLFVTERKTKKSRIIPFNDEFRKIVGELYELLDKPKKTSYLFMGKMGKPMTVQHINRKLKVIRDRYALSITNFSTHTFRKTFGRSYYEARGKTEAALHQLQKILNHSNAGITYVYIGIRNDEINDFYDHIQYRTMEDEED